ncbi:esterase/lipase family protein [Enhygromyxa salina]|uniref:Lecithin:cholesterol acyltransferase n=1 Tax=Enhygromyxa salina TaxID=215803 RepID=A0A2S9Y2W0_9BACT|nr:alpha/beta hydrolase [Enhygromyxa salina]PRP99330.1 Lecithin:cholesterol acyltransferase [Enhygromyxa salina]
MTVQPVARRGGNTIDSDTIPIVFVPGVMGSRLHFPSINCYWDPDHTITRMTHWLTSSAERVRREFALSNPAVVMTVGDDLDAQQRERGWAGVAWDFYGSLLEHLSEQRYGGYHTPVYAIGYDWRQSNNDSGDAICRRLEEILAAEQAERFILLTHSMGGLASRAGLHRNPAVAAKLAGVCHIAQPVTGAAIAVRRMFTGATYGSDGVAMMLLLGNNRKKYQTICSAMPGPMQLLATQDFTDTDGGWWYSYETFERPGIERDFAGQCWELYARPQSPPGLLAAADSRYAIAPVPRREFSRRVNEARAFHLALGLWKHAETWSFYGTGNECDTSLYFELPPVEAELSLLSTALHSLNPFSEDVRYKAKRADGSEVSIGASEVDPADRGCAVRRTNDSDGTVPLSSGKALFPTQAYDYREGTEYDLTTQRQFFTSGGEQHDQICKDTVCLAFVDELITHLVGT